MIQLNYVLQMAAEIPVYLSPDSSLHTDKNLNQKFQVWIHHSLKSIPLIYTPVLV